MNIKQFWKAVLAQDKIISVDEYWSDDGEAPQWRQEMHIGRPIK